MQIENQWFDWYKGHPYAFCHGSGVKVKLVKLYKRNRAKVLEWKTKTPHNVKLSELYYFAPVSVPDMLMIEDREQAKRSK